MFWKSTPATGLAEPAKLSVPASRARGKGTGPPKAAFAVAAPVERVDELNLDCDVDLVGGTSAAARTRIFTAAGKSFRKAAWRPARRRSRRPAS